MKFLPQDREFYDLFQQQGTLIHEAAKLLHEGVGAENADWEHLSRRMYQLENRGDEVRHQILKRLHDVFITPIDPEDIHDLSSRLDDALDAIDALASRFYVFRSNQQPEPVRKMTDILISSSSTCSDALAGLAKNQDISELLIRLHDLEDEADKIYQNAMFDLFGNSHEAVELLKAKEIYEMLEEAADAFEAVSHALEGIVLKNA